MRFVIEACVNAGWVHDPAVAAEHVVKMEKQHHRRAKQLGYEVKKIEPLPPVELLPATPLLVT